MTTQLTKAARNAIAWTHLRGRMPKHLHKATWWAVYKHIMWDGARDRVRPEFVPMVELHPMVAKVRELEAAGWALDRRDRNRKVRLGVALERDHGDTVGEIQVWPDGKTSSVWERKKISCPAFDNRDLQARFECGGND